MARRTEKKDELEGGVPPSGGRIEEVPFHTTARRKYLNYALSVITSRALPDVRDGLKPVQRRILYTMYNDLHLSPTAKPIKCARIVGDVLGKYHPHGDTAVYDALVRMAQDFSLRYPLVDGHGNFGSLDGDGAAAYRYTEARLRTTSMELLDELGQGTVDFRPNYDGRTREPIVLPARLPHLLVNGATGIAVGMATNIPPHNLSEVARACEALIDDRDLKVSDLLQFVKGPDFPTGGQILNSRAEIRAVYEEGQGTLRVRAEHKEEDGPRGGRRVVITSIPYMVPKDALVRGIGELIYQRKLPMLLDVRDESTTDVRIVCEVKRDADLGMVMAYLYKHTQLQSNFNVNLTCLVPSDRPEVPTPAKLDLKSILVHFIDFRYGVVERRFRHERELLLERIHILEGFRKVFGGLDEAIQIIRASDGKADAAEKLKARFKLDGVQAEAILELKLFRIARLEIRSILEELREKKARVAEIEAILASARQLWGVVRSEIKDVRERHGDPRRTRIGGRGVEEEEEYDEEAYIVDEDAIVLLSRDGWVKRVGRVGDLSKVRLRPEDELLVALGGNTKTTTVFLSNLGSAYTIRINDIPPSRGYGDPIQRFFKFRDGERSVGALSFDPRILSGIGSASDPPESVPPTHAVAVSSSGYVLRFPLFPFEEPSTRAGRKFVRLKEGEEIVGVHVITGKETVILATRMGRVILFPASEVNLLSGPGRGVLGIKLEEGDRVFASAVSTHSREGLTVVTTGGRKARVTPGSYKVAGRGGKGYQVIKRGGLTGVEREEISLPTLGEEESGGGRNGNRKGHGRGNGNGNGKGGGVEETRKGTEPAPDDLSGPEESEEGT
jgi:DNA gyrase subunit A